METEEQKPPQVWTQRDVAREAAKHYRLAINEKELRAKVLDQAVLVCRARGEGTDAVLLTANRLYRYVVFGDEEMG